MNIITGYIIGSIIGTLAFIILYPIYLIITDPFKGPIARIKHRKWEKKMEKEHEQKIQDEIQQKIKDLKPKQPLD